MRRLLHSHWRRSTRSTGSWETRHGSLTEAHRRRSAELRRRSAKARSWGSSEASWGSTKASWRSKLAHCAIERRSADAREVKEQRKRTRRSTHHSWWSRPQRPCHPASTALISCSDLINEVLRLVGSESCEAKVTVSEKPLGYVRAVRTGVVLPDVGQVVASRVVSFADCRASAGVSV